MRGGGRGNLCGMPMSAFAAFPAAVSDQRITERLPRLPTPTALARWFFGGRLHDRADPARLGHETFRGHGLRWRDG